MADPTLELTFGDFIIRVAEYLGLADYSGGTAAVPVAAHDLDLCKRLVNDGYRRFVTSKRNWNWQTQPVTITFDPTGLGAQCVAGDPGRYYMPYGFTGGVLMPWTYDSTGPRMRIAEASEGIIRQLFSGGTIQGNPKYIGFRPIAMTPAGSTQRWEALLFPTPNAVYTITSLCRIFPDKLVNLTDHSVAGFSYDEAILACALGEAERQRNDKSDVQRANMNDALARAIAMDESSTPRRLGDYGDGSDSGFGPGGRRPLNYYSVDTYNGVNV